MIAVLQCLRLFWQFPYAASVVKCISLPLNCARLSVSISFQSVEQYRPCCVVCGCLLNNWCCFERGCYEETDVYFGIVRSYTNINLYNLILYYSI